MVRRSADCSIVANQSRRTAASPKTRAKCGSSARRSSSVSFTSDTSTRSRTPVSLRRGRDSNPRAFRLPAFQAGALGHYATSPTLNYGSDRAGRYSVDRELRIRVPRDFPEMSVRILEVRRVATPSAIRGRVRDFRTGRTRQRDDLIDLFLRSHVVSDLEAGRSMTVCVDPRFVCE